MEEKSEGVRTIEEEKSEVWRRGEKKSGGEEGGQKREGEGERRGQMRREGRRTDRSDVVCRRGGEISGVGR